MNQVEKPVFPPLEAEDWPIVRKWARLDDLCDGVFDCPHTTPDITEAGPFVVRSQDVRTGIFRLDQAARVSEETYQERIARAEPRYGDILYSREGTYFGLAAEVPPGVRVCLGQRMVLIRPTEKIDTRFLRLWLNSPILHRHIMGFRDGTVAERLNMPTIRGLPVPAITLPEQRAIAATLGALDDKIELNRKMNATLEAMARALFRDWFVTFGPTRARMEGRAPYLSPDLWPLFPARLDDQGKPEGWEVRRVDQILELAYGKALKSTDRQPGSVPVYGSGGITGSHSEALVEGPSVIVGRKGTVGSLYWEDRPFFPIDTVFYVRPFVPLTVCYYALEQMGLDNMNTDAAVPGLNRNNVYRLQLAWPGEAIVRAFDDIASVIRARIKNNSAESQTLARTRDFLLPRLMSGEVRVAEAARAVEAAL